MTKKRKKICKLRKYTYLCIPKNDGAVAQMVEQWTENPCVGSSILPSTTNYADNQLVTNFTHNFTHNEREVVRLF